MAINTQKFLPSSKGGALAKVSKISKGSIAVISEKSQKNIGIIRVKVIEIDKLLKGTVASQKAALDNKKRETISKRREDLETKLETKPKAESGKIKMPKTPRMGFLDWIKNFIGNIILGYFAVRLVDQLPKLKGVISFIGKATDFILDIGGKLLDGLVTFVDWGYKAYDATRGFMKNLFGDAGVKQFDQLSSALNKFLNLAIIVGMIAASGDGFGGGGRGGGGGSRFKPGQGGRPRVTTSGGRGLNKPDVRNPLRQRPTVTTGGGSKQFRLPGSGAKVTGSGGANRLLLSQARPFLKRIPLPIVGALVDFGLSVALGENPGRAAFRAIGAGLLGAVGAAAGTVVPVAGNFIGGLVGGFAGDAIGGALYDMFFSGKPPTQKGKTTKVAGGGTAKGTKRRTLNIKKGKYKRKLAPRKPGEIEMQPGADVGGEDKIFGLFPNPLKTAQNAIDMMNPFKVIENTGKELGKSDYFGPILAITSKILLGQKPTQKDYENVGLGINLLVSKGISEGNLKGGLAAFAEGGFVDPKALDAISQGGDITNWVAKAFRESTESNTQDTLREIQDNLRLKKGEPDEPDSDPTLEEDDEGGPGGMTKGKWGPLLDLIAGKESGGNYEAMYPSTTLKGATKMTIAEVAKRATGAVGKYQQLPQYLVGRAKAAGLDPNKDLYSPENQEKIIINVNIKGRGGERWLKGEISDEQFMQGLSQEFASLPNANGQFYYPGQRSAMTADKVKSALSKVKKGGYSQKELSDNIDIGTGGSLGNIKGYSVTRNGQTIKNYSQLAPHHDYTTTSDGRRVQDMTLYKGKEFLNIPVPSPVSGKVSWAGPTKGGGNWVEVQSDDGKVELGHFNKIVAKPGQKVQAFKSILGLQGHTGSISPPGIDGTHLHIQAPDKVVSRYVNSLAKGGAAYAKGGETLAGPHLAMLGEKGSEIVVDADSSGPARDMLLAINQAKDHRGVMKAIQQYAPYDAMSPQTIVMPSSGGESDYDSEMSDGGAMMMDGGGEDSYDPFATLYQGG